MPIKLSLQKKSIRLSSQPDLYSRLCEEGGGDCESDWECAGSLVCGHNNCLHHLGHQGGLWDATDDCCVRKCRPDSQCLSGEVVRHNKLMIPRVTCWQGSCLTDGDCYGSLSSCSHSCSDSNVFPVARYPNNSGSIEFSPSDK